MLLCLNSAVYTRPLPKRCVAAKANKDLPYAFNGPGLQNKVAPYTLQDFLVEMGDPKASVKRALAIFLLCGL